MKLGPDLAAVITGGASGLGAATAQRLASHGVKVAIFDLDTVRGEALASSLGGVYCEVDVSSDASVDAGLVRARAAHGQERILVNCAGIGRPGRTASIDRATGAAVHYPMEAYERVIGVNLIGTFRCIAKSTRGMLEIEPGVDGERGIVINTASIAAQDGQIGQAAYASSKAGIVGLTLPVARDFMGSGIRVNTIVPGLFDTPALHRLTPQVREALAANVPFPRRLGHPDEFAAVVETLITTAYFNGESIRLDGGLRMAPR